MAVDGRSERGRAGTAPRAGGRAVARAAPTGDRRRFVRWGSGLLAAVVLLFMPFLTGTALPAGTAGPASGGAAPPSGADTPVSSAGGPVPGSGGPVPSSDSPVASSGPLDAALDSGTGDPDGSGRHPDTGATATGTVDLDRLAQRQWEETEGAASFLEALDRVRQQVGEAVPGLDWEHTLQALRRGELPWDAGDLLGALFRALAGEVVTNGGLLLRLLVLAVLLAVLQAIENAFDNEAVARAAYAVTYLALIALALVSFRDAMAVSQQAIRGLVDFLLASLPVLLTLMASTGALATAGILHPLVVATAHSTSVIVSQWVLPLIFLAAVVDIAGYFPVGTSLSGLSRLLRQAALVILGLAGTVFLTVVAIQGAAGTVADGIALRTAKYLVGTFIPVVGGMLSDSVELVVTSSLLLKNAVNLLGMLAVFALVVFPLLKLVALVFVYRLVAAAIQPVGPGHVTGALQSMGDHLVLVGAATTVVGLMFFIVMAVMLAAGNAAVMMR